MGAEEPINPYVGPRPFEREDASRFFGRTREFRDVVSLVIAQRVLLLYSASGAWQVVVTQRSASCPYSRTRRTSTSCPSRGSRADDPPTNGNVFVSGLLSSLDGGAAANLSLAELLAGRLNRSRTGLRVLVVDQFEESFLWCIRDGRTILGLFEELREAMEHDPGLRIVLAIREDFLAQLDPFAAMLTCGLRTRFRLERLDRASVLAAVKNPLAGTDRSFAPGAAEALVDDLLRLRVDTGRGESEEVKGEYVEPVQLQVACMTLWADLPPDVSEITTQQLSAYADVDQVLARFYDDAVATAAGTSRRRERHVRAWVEETFITPGGTRAAAYAAANDTAGMPSEIVKNPRGKAPDPGRMASRRTLVRVDARPTDRAHPAIEWRLQGCDGHEENTAADTRGCDSLRRRRGSHRARDWEVQRQGGISLHRLPGAFPRRVGAAKCEL